ncbi:MAG: HypC/HybG/HupF family hydrogenase formation chaperone [Promethearchaeati archaeon]
MDRDAGEGSTSYTRIEEDYAQVDFSGVSKKICVSLLADFEEGEYVILHTGYGIEKIKPEEAKKTIKLREEMAEMAADMMQDAKHQAIDCCKDGMRFV